ncbi:general stress protein [Arcobacter sp. CECT 8986]|uniref:NAD(P)H-dependent oxidoreductase n=1 Tax=Arcobacter sp. CECT 8986 TaxID=2044507 RepID=UPI001009938F|nr:NAD(P)H-dependent oxidoreductase [Arcobacter sp. CECT 8986]RXK00493.1 general stress protein [Arcobacter sp. CECT 8986]
MKKVLVNLIHPNIEESRVNKKLLEEVSKLGNVTVNNLYKNYPDFNIDVEREQKLLVEHDIIVLQFPVYWFSSPALLKEWSDKVLGYGFAYGPAYNLEGKDLLVAVSTGSAAVEYSAQGHNKHEISEYLRPYEGTARYTHMNYPKEFVSYASFVISDEELAKNAVDYKEYVEKLSK